MNVFNLKGNIKYILFSIYNFILNKNRLCIQKNKSNIFYLTAMLRIKNEARFLPELIAYHLELGIEHFYLYDNQSTDNPREVLKPFINSGYVTIIDWPIRPASPRCYFDFWQKYAHLSKWVAFIDADEYIVEPTDGFLKNHLLSIEGKVPALALNWMYFGSSGHDKIPAGLLIQNFKRCGNDINRHVKVIVQPEQVHSTYNSHNFVYFFPRLARLPNNSPVLGSHCPVKDVTHFRINHYVYRSRENHISKSSIGYVDAQGAVQNRRDPKIVEKRAEEEFVKHNEFFDDFVSLNLSDKVRIRLKALGYGAPFI